MNIDYAKIIETANARKEKLQELERLLDGAEQARLAAAQAYTYLAELKRVADSLDVEGRELLPKAVYEQVYRIGPSQIQQTLSTPVYIGHTLTQIGLEPLARAVKEAQVQQ